MSTALAIVGIFFFLISFIIIIVFLLLRFIGNINPFDMIIGTFKNTFGIIGNLGDNLVVDPAKDVGNKVTSIF